MLFADDALTLSGWAVSVSTILGFLWLYYDRWKTRNKKDRDDRIAEDKQKLDNENAAILVGEKKHALDEQIRESVANCYRELIAELKASHAADMRAFRSRLTALELRETECQDNLNRLRRENGAQDGKVAALEAELADVRTQLEASQSDRTQLRKMVHDLRDQLQTQGVLKAFTEAKQPHE